MIVTLRDSCSRILNGSTRIPFRFGVMTLHDVGQITLRATVETADGRRAEGFASELLIPKWFDKRANVSHRQNVLDLIASVTRATEVMTGRSGTIFDTWWHAYQDIVLSIPDRPLRLVAGFGISLLERAMIDGLCRATQSPFVRALRSHQLGIDAGRVHPLLTNWNPGFLPPPRRSVTVRHTVGLLDPLEAADLPPGEKMRDGLPHLLSDVIARYGVDHFKVKICGDREWDRSRLLRIAALLESQVGAYRTTVDGNEQYQDAADLASVLHDVAATPHGLTFVKSLIAIEQPLPRSIALQSSVAPGIAALSKIAPVIIDESDADAYCFPDAVNLGYRGVSVKGCKGIVRAVLNRGLCDMLGDDYFQTGEDLTTLGGFGVQQDLVLMAALGIEHVERNGHHYFRGLDHLPVLERQQVKEHHPDLYEFSDGFARLRIEEGELRLGSLLDEGFGGSAPAAFDARIPLERWEPLP